MRRSKMRRRDLENMIAHARNMQKPKHQRRVKVGSEWYSIVTLEVDDVEVLLKAAEALVEIRNRMDQTLRPCG